MEEVVRVGYRGNFNDDGAPSVFFWRIVVRTLFIEQLLHCNDSLQEYDHDYEEYNNDDSETLQYSISEVKIFFVSGRVYGLRKLAN